MRLLVVLIITGFVYPVVRCQMSDFRDFCTKVLENPSTSCDVAQCQGRPGKRGPQGIQGLKGGKGDHGPGNEDLQSELEELQGEMRENEKSSVLNFCAMGMKNGAIGDGSIAVSSSSSVRHGKQWGRLDQRLIAGTSNSSWCADSNDRNKWIRIDFGRMKEISGIITQGNPSENHWTTTYSVSCGDTDGRFVDLTEYGSVKIFRGNSDRNEKSVNFFAEKITCRYIRIHPKAWNGQPCMRLEILRGMCYSPDYYTFYLESAGYEDGNTAKVLINGVDRAYRGIGRCHAVVIFNPQTKEITAKAFDTYISTVQTKAMVNFINAAPDYSVIAVAVMDSTNPEHITGEASALFQRLGAVGTACNTKPASRDAWAFITQKVRSSDPRPSWVKCKHVRRHNGKATLHATITTSAHYGSWEDTPIA